MKIPEKIFVAIVGVGLIFKIMLWPFSGLLLVLSIGSLSTYYLVLSWLTFRPRDNSDHKTWVSILTGFLFSYGLIGVLFKLMFWPASNPPLLFSLIGLAPLLLLSLLSKNEATKNYYSALSGRIIVMFIIFTIFLSLPTKTLYAFLHRNDQKRIELYNRAQDNPMNEQYAKEHAEYVKTHH